MIGPSPCNREGPQGLPGDEHLFGRVSSAARRWSDLLQRVCPCPGGVKSYVASVEALLTEEALRCPFCADGHRLRQNGRYRRWALLPDPTPAERIPVLRLRCSRTGRTVSLLPDFCLPRRQHGPGILGIFVDGVVHHGVGLHAALRRARGAAMEHSTAQSLMRGFVRRQDALRTYLAGLRARAIPPPDGFAGLRRALAPVVLALLADHPDPVSAFVHHGHQFHRRFALALA
jgi:hypothetical protein